MLIKYYSPHKHRTLNNDNLNGDIIGKWKNLSYPTSSLEVFSNLNASDLFKMMDEQLNYIKKEAEIYLKYGFLTQKSYEITLEQYGLFFYHDEKFYLKTEVKAFISEETSSFNTYIDQPPLIEDSSEDDKIKIKDIEDDTILEKVNKSKSHQDIVEISRQGIRNITGYSPYFKPVKWEGPRVYVARQDRLIEDENSLILVLGSRQIGKSYSLSEKAIEESHIPNNDILVGAFTSSSTNTIRNYIRRLIKKFPEDYWGESKAERYIQNMKTGSKIYFRTLADDAVDAIRGMTLSTLLIDEAQLVSEYAYEEVLKPTLATTGGKMILIGTPPKIPDGYFVDKIFQYKRGETKNTSFYEIKLPDQPFTHPDVRAEIMERKDEPRIQRERFCNLTSDVESLFQFKKSEGFPMLSSRAIITLGIDPARKKDRSGYTVTATISGKSYIIESGFVPDTFKKKWELQAVYLKKIKTKYERFGEVTTVLDATGVGDGVSTVFNQNGLKINITVRYTSGSSVSQEGTHYTAAKSYLINTTLDMISEDTVEVVDITNDDLLEETQYIYETESRSGLIGFKTKFFDDITNSAMLTLFVVKERKLLSKSLSNIPVTFKQPSGVPFIDGIEGRGVPEPVSSVW